MRHFTDPNDRKQFLKYLANNITTLDKKPVSPSQLEDEFRSMNRIEIYHYLLKNTYINGQPIDIAHWEKTNELRPLCPTTR